MKAMRYYCFSALLFLSFLGCSGQDSRQKLFGREWVAQIPSKAAFNSLMNHDTIVFRRPYCLKDDADYWYVNLHDSGKFFQQVFVTTDTSINGNIESWATYSLDHDGVYRLDSLEEQISFTFFQSGVQYNFKIIQKGNQETNTHDLYRSDNDYRTHIVLVKLQTTSD